MITDDWLGMDPPSKPVQKPIVEEDPIGYLHSAEGEGSPSARRKRASRRTLRIDRAPAGNPSESTGLNTPGA